MNKSIIKIVPKSNLKIKDLPNEVIELIYDFVYGVFIPYYGIDNYRKYYSNCLIYNRSNYSYGYNYVIFVLEEKRNDLREGLVKFLIKYNAEKTNVKSTIKSLKVKNSFF